MASRYASNPRPEPREDGRKAARTAFSDPGLNVAALLFCAAAAAPFQAQAAPATVAFSIPAEPLADALVDFGLQAGVSIGVRDIDACGGANRALAGRYTAQDGLTRLLAGSRCTFQVVDAVTYRVGPRAPPPPSDAAAAPPPVQDEEPYSVPLGVTVTATKRPSLVERTPASVSIIGSDLLTAGRIDSLSDLAADFAGVTATNLGPGRDKLFVRGLSDGAFTGRTQSTVGLYLDDAPITYSAPDPDLRLVDMDRVELLRGPQGSLYGEGSIGGIVLMVTKKPDLSNADAGVAIGSSLTQHGQTSGSVDAMVNIPLVQDRVGLRAVAYDEKMGGYLDNVLTGADNVNQTRRYGGRAAITAEIGSNWSVTGGVTYQSLKSADTQYADEALGRLQRDNWVPEPHDNKFAQAHLTVEGGGDWGRLKVSTAYLDHAFDSNYDASMALPVFGQPLGEGVFTEANRVRLAVAEATLTSPPGSKLQWLAGAFASTTRQTSILNLDALDPDGPLTLYQEDRRDRLGEFALYGEASYPLTARLSATVGLRAFHSWLHTDSNVVQDVQTRPFSGRTDSNAVSPKFVLSWQLRPTTLVYFEASEGYRVGGFNTSGRIGQLFTAATSGRQPDRLFRPDQLWSLETGLKATLLQKKLQLHSAVYFAYWNDIQSDQFLGSGMPYTANIGSGVDTGLETEAVFKVDRHLTLQANVLINGTDLTRRDPTYPARKNASLPAVPSRSAALIADYRRPLANDLQLVLHGRLSYVGSSILTVDEGTQPSQGKYATGKLSGGVETPRWRLIVFVDNPADVTGDTFAFGDPFSLGRVAQVTPLRPRTVGVTLAVGL